MAFFQAEKRPSCFLDKLPRGEKEQRMKSGKMDFGRKRNCFLSCERRGEGREGGRGGVRSEINLGGGKKNIAGYCKVAW